MLDVFAQSDAWMALLALTSLEIVLGIDNVVFIAILAAKLPEGQQKRAYRLGLMGALGTRLLLLFTISWVMQLSDPLFHVGTFALSGRDLILLGGGLFLIAKSSTEIYNKVEASSEEQSDAKKGRARMGAVIFQIMLLDVVFSLDSVITAVGMADHFVVMATAVVIAILVMLIFAQKIGDFVNRHPSMKVLALSFLLLIGVLLVAEGLGQHIDKGYIYFAMGFSLLVELINMRVRGTPSRAAAADGDVLQGQS